MRRIVRFSTCSERLVDRVAELAVVGADPAQHANIRFISVELTNEVVRRL